jgi:CotH kinase protein/Chitobiase/beta-hexosaminidase C-terminal domain/Secretion system C-terminal sorting domain
VKNFLLSILCFLFLGNVFGQIVINEVCSANGTVIADFEGDYEDWLEIYNPTSQTVSLNGYYLETFDTKQKRWSFPDFSLKPDSCMLVFCSKKDRKAIIDHYELPILPGSTWRYFVGTTEPDPNWVNPGFDDSSWLTGAQSIGYGDADDATVIAPTTSLYMRDTFSLPAIAKPNFLSAFIAIDYDDAFVAYLNGVEIARNNIWNIGKPPFDAFATEEHEAAIYSCPTPGLLDCAEFFFIDEEIIQQALVVGLNVFSVQVHNYDQGLDDMSVVSIPIFGVFGSDTTFISFPETSNLHTNFNLSSKGQRLSLKDSNDVTVDEYILDDTRYNHSRGRFPDGSANWCLMEIPSPCGANTGNCKSGYADAPSINLESGFYNGTQIISISTINSTDEIRYTTDGSWPTTTSTLYTSPITITGNSTIRAVTLSSDAAVLSSATTTRTYVIDETSTLPVIFITTDSLWLFDTLSGIYVLGPNTDTTVQAFPYWGTANYYQEAEIPGHVEFLDQNLDKQLGQDCAIKIHGNFSRGWEQRSFRFLANDKYGDKDFDFAPFPNKPNVTSFKSFNVRNGGVDFNTTHVRDGLMQRAARDLDLEMMDHQSTLVYINGKYWGVYGLRERQNAKYLEDNYDVDGENVELLRFSGDEFHGSNESYLDMVDFISNNDMSIDSNYAKATTLLDISNFCDYMTAETYYGNYDWISEGGSTNNIKFWRQIEPATPWRYILWDTDLGLNLVLGFGGATGVDYDYLGDILGPTYSDPHSRMLLSLLDNQTFHDYFINRFADIVNTTFSPATFGKVAQEVHDAMEPEMARHFSLWGSPPKFIFSSFWLSRSSNVSEWNNEFDSIFYFINNRPFYARNNVEALFSLNKQVDVTLDVEPVGAGSVTISTVTPTSYPWTGVYYDGVPVTISVSANPGFLFSNWTATSSFTSKDTASFKLNITSDDAFVAHFDVVEYDLNAYPNPFSSELTLDFYMKEEGQASIKLFDLSGKLITSIVDYTTFYPAGLNSITFDPASIQLKSGAYVIHFETNGVEKMIKMVHIRK